MANIELIEHASKFIEELDIPAPDPSLKKIPKGELAILANDKAGAAIDAGSLVSFVSGISPIHKSDVLNSTLLAQLAADKQYNRFTDTRLWYSFYTSVLSNVGWVVPAFAFRQYRPSGSSLVLSDAVLQILAAVATGNELAILTASLNALRDKPENEGALTLFDRQSFPENLGTFQIFPVGEDDGQLVMALAALQFNAVKHVTRFLWFRWESVQSSLFQSAQKAVLNEAVYSRVRQQVIDKLGDNASKFIDDLEI